MAFYKDEFKVIHCDFEAEMYESPNFDYRLTLDSGANKYSISKCKVTVSWKFSTFERNSNVMYGSYISEERFVIDYPNDIRELKWDIQELLCQSLIQSRDKFIEMNDGFKNTAILHFQCEDFPNQNHVEFVLSQILKTF